VTSIPRPPHHSGSVNRGLGDDGGYFPDADSVERYTTLAVESAYGADRLRAVRALLDRVTLPHDASIVDFGGGDGAFLRDLDIRASRIDLVDVSPHMLEAAERTLPQQTLRTHLGSVERLADLEAGGTDLVLCIDTLGYLEDREQEQFFSECHRILASDGAVVLMSGNELLDLFALNSGTAEFFARHFDVSVGHLLSLGDEERWVNAKRWNPLSFGCFVARFGFREVGQAFSQWHRIPPGLAVQLAGGDLGRARSEARDHSLDPQQLPEEDRWQALLRCSTFASLCVRAD
jgi:hypothetical protein